MKKIQNLPYDICLAVFDYDSLGDSTQIKSLFNSTVSLGRFEIIKPLFSSVIDQDLDKFKYSELDAVKNFKKQSQVFLATISMIVMLKSQEEGINIYNPKSLEPCLCKIGSAIIKNDAPNFHRSTRALYEYVVYRYLKTSTGYNNLERSRVLHVKFKRQQFERLVKKYKINKEVHDFNGSSWVTKIV